MSVERSDPKTDEILPRSPNAWEKTKSALSSWAGPLVGALITGSVLVLIAIFQAFNEANWKVNEATLGTIIEKVDGQTAVVNERFDSLGKQLENVDEKFEGLSGRLDGMDRRLDVIDERQWDARDKTASVKSNPPK